MTSDEAKALWPLVRRELGPALEDARALVIGPPKDLRELIEARYLAGCEEFSGDWTTRSGEWCTENASEELADLVTYLAFRRVLRMRPRLGSSVTPSQ